VNTPIIVHGHPNDSELAALTALLMGLRPGADAEPTPVRRAPGWGSPRDRLRIAPVPGPGAWQAALRH